MGKKNRDRRSQTQTANADNQLNKDDQMPDQNQDDTLKDLSEETSGKKDSTEGGQDTSGNSESGTETNSQDTGAGNDAASGAGNSSPEGGQDTGTSSENADAEKKAETLDKSDATTANDAVSGSQDSSVQTGTDSTANNAPAQNVADTQQPPVVDTTVPANASADVVIPAVQDNASTTTVATNVVAPVVQDTSIAAASVDASSTTTVSPVVDEKAEMKSAFDQHIDRLKEEGTDDQKRLIVSLEAYMENMKPGMPVNPVQGAGHQVKLWQVLREVVEKTAPEKFDQMWRIVLAFFHVHGHNKGVFNGRYVFRFSDHWNRDQAEHHAFNRLLNLIHLTADASKLEDGLSQVDLAKTMDRPFTEEARSRILAFYRR